MRSQIFSVVTIFLFVMVAIGCNRQTHASGEPTSMKPQEAREGAIRVSGTDPANWKTYRNEQYGVELKYPETWTVGGEGSGTNETTGKPAQRTKVWMIGFRKPHREGEPDVYLTLSIQENENPKRLTIDEFVAEEMRGMKNASAPLERMTIGAQAAVFMDVTTSLGKKTRAIFCLLRETDLLSLVYPSSTQFDPIFAEMISSLRFVK